MVWDHPLELVGLPGPIILKKIVFPSPGSHQVPVSLLLEEGIYESIRLQAEC